MPTLHPPRMEPTPANPTTHLHRQFGHAVGEAWFRLTAASQVLQSDDSRGRNLTFVILQGERPLYLQQRPFNSDVPLTVQS